MVPQARLELRGQVAIQGMKNDVMTGGMGAFLGVQVIPEYQRQPIEHREHGETDSLRTIVEKGKNKALQCPRLATVTLGDCLLTMIAVVANKGRVLLL